MKLLISLLCLNFIADNKKIRIMQKNITLPSKPVLISEEGNTGVYEIDALYPGYGYTLGNALRRILLSSIPGFAVTKIKIKGVKQEFSSIDGILDDVIDIVLNIKKIRINSDSIENGFTVSLKKKGKGVVKASDIELPSNVVIGNKDAYITEITKDSSSLDIELVVQKGIGFLKAEDRKDETEEVGSIVLDALFSPIKLVQYNVENTRVDDRTDFNKLIIKIETDKTINHKEALEQSIKIMIEQLKAIVSVAGSVDEEEFITGDPSRIHISNLSLTPAVSTSLESAGIKTVGDLEKKSKEEIVELQGIGDKAMDSIATALAEHGIKF